MSPLLRQRPTIEMSLTQALYLAITEAPELKVLQSDWMIQQQEVCRQDAVFDSTAFVDSIWNRDSNPVGSDLDGATDRLRSRTLSSSIGVRRLTRSGVEWQLSQDFGLYSSNSVFINPNYQGNSRLALELRKPLFRGAGEFYNTSRTRLAQIEQATAYDRLQAGIQDHLLEVASAYWMLVLQRGRFLQSVTAWNRARALVEEMQSRVEIDVTPAMMERAETELANRLATCIEVEYDVVRGQDALLRLIYGERFIQFAGQEILTSTRPLRDADTVEPQPQIERALQNRSEIHEAIRRIKASSVQLDVARNEIQPVLDMVLTGYSAGLEGNNDIGTAFRNQFREGEPGVGIGFNFEVPYRNRAARAGAEQARLAVHRMQSEFQAITARVTQDVRNQVIQRNKYSSLLPQHWTALNHSNQVLEYTQTRRRYLADGIQVADLYLENLLQMQGRVALAEYTFLQSQIRCSMADSSLARAVAGLPAIISEAPPEAKSDTSGKGNTPHEPALQRAAAQPDAMHASPVANRSRRRVR